MIKNILLAFIPIFVAVDALGLIPIFISLTNEIERKEKNKIIVQSMITALTLAVIFIFLGKIIFNLLGITVGDFMIAGGTILFCIAIFDITSSDKKRHNTNHDLGAVPLGTPLIVGPAVLTTSLTIVSEYGLVVSLISIFLNIVIAGVILYLSDFIIKIIGISGSKALSKITSLLLAAIAIMLIRKGLVLIINLIKC